MNPALDQIAISGIRRFNDAVATIPDMIRLTLGEPDFKTPMHIKQAAIEAINADYSHYTDNAGDPELRAAVRHAFRTQYHLDYRAEDEILVTVGATEALAVAIQAMTSPGDAVIVPAPIYPGYLPLLALNQVTPIIIDTRASDFILTPELIEQAVATHPSARISGIILNYPNNPTGTTFTASQLKALAEVITAHDWFILADEVYAAITYNAPHVSIAQYARDHTILISGLSKSHAMTGWRIGFLLAPSRITQAIKKVHQYTVTAATTIAQRAAIEALTHGANDSVTMRTTYRHRRDFLFQAVRDLGFEGPEPTGAFYLFAKIPSTINLTSEAFCTALAHDAHLALIPGTAFGPEGEGYVRMSYAASEADLHEAVRRLRHYLDQY